MIHKFINNYLDPADRLAEILFGLIMALGFTAAVRLGREDADNQALFVGILGCNVAWAIVDGVMYALVALFERGRRIRAAREVNSAPTEEAAMQRIADEMDSPLLTMVTPEERDRIHRRVLELLRGQKHEIARMRLEDVLGGAAVALIIVLVTLPVVVPFLLMSNPNTAVRVSNAVALIQLFMLGTWWGRMVGGSPLRIGLGLTVVGGVLVLVTIALGG